MGAKPAKRRREWRIVYLALGIVAGILILIVLALLGPLVVDVYSADCGWSGQTQAWIDSDGDTVWDEEEIPLANVRIFTDDKNLAFRLFRMYESGRTDKDGKLDLLIWLPGCPDTQIVVYAKAPDCYTLTTKALLDGELEGPYLFGFEPIDAAESLVNCSSEAK